MHGFHSMRAHRSCLSTCEPVSEAGNSTHSSDELKCNCSNFVLMSRAVLRSADANEICRVRSGPPAPGGPFSAALPLSACSQSWTARKYLFRHTSRAIKQTKNARSRQFIQTRMHNMVNPARCLCPVCPVAASFLDKQALAIPRPPFLGLLWS